MYVDAALKIEAISLLFGKIIRPFDEKRRNRAAHTLSVGEFHLQTITGEVWDYINNPYIRKDDFFDPEYDYDFTNLSDSEQCLRGNELYKRPKGWYRIALKVRGKYPDDTWLGTDGWRSHSVPGEWPVSYHGTSLAGAKGIIREHYKAGEGDRYGRGIYSTPDVDESEVYAKTFKSKTTGKIYKVALQNRINPEERVICQREDYWLIPVNKGTSAEEERRIVESSIRPYDVLIKELRGRDKTCSVCTVI